MINNITHEIMDTEDKNYELEMKLEIAKVLILRLEEAENERKIEEYKNEIELRKKINSENTKLREIKKNENI